MIWVTDSSKNPTKARNPSHGKPHTSNRIHSILGGFINTKTRTQVQGPCFRLLSLEITNPGLTPPKMTLPLPFLGQWSLPNQVTDDLEAQNVLSGEIL